MSGKKLKPSSLSKVAAKIRKAIGAGPDDNVEVTTPQFERPAGEPPPMAAPTSVAGFDALRTMTDAQRLELGMRRWGRPEPHDLAVPLRKGSKKADLSGSPMLWLFPGEWYSKIPPGYEIVDISYYIEKFKRGKTDNDIRFGCLAFGVLVRDAS